MNHAGYIAATVAAMRADGLRVLDVPLASTPRRQATLALDPTHPASAFTDLQKLTADWDETHGWALTLTRTHGHHTLYYGQPLVPEPTVTAAWLALALTAPALTTDRRHDPPVPDPDTLDELLATYERT